MDELTITVMDEDVTSDDKVGIAQVKLSSLCINNGVRDWVFKIYITNFSSHFIGKINTLVKYCNITLTNSL